MSFTRLFYCTKTKILLFISTFLFIPSLSYADTNVTPAAAVRLLEQASFGPSMPAIAEVQGLGIEGWIDDQLSLPITRHSPLVNGDPGRKNQPRVTAWMQAAIHAEDQLRQRMAYALSQIFVASQKSSILRQKQAGLLSYYDMLLDNALGNFRELLYDVTYHPVMGSYLTYAGNKKGNQQGTREPDENYARELLQLFSVGPYLLNLDGSYQLSEHGNRLDTYNEAHIKEFAQVFTGLCYEDRCDIRFADHIHPMVENLSVHDLSTKLLLNGTVLPENVATVEEDINGALDNIFNHDNVAPFISKKLIQFLVTSNPTPSYISRVATVFNDNGDGVKGDLASVAKAILMDDEARNGHVNLPNTFGKMREPIIRMAHFYRAFEHYSWGGAPKLYNLENRAFQAPLTAPSVFNFYPADFKYHSLPDGIVSPEFGISNQSQFLHFSNDFYRQLRSTHTHQYEQITQLMEDPGDIQTGIDRIDLLFTGSNMSDELRTVLTDIIEGTRQADLRPDGSSKNRFNDIDGVANAMVVVFTSPEFVIQR